MGRLCRASTTVPQTSGRSICSLCSLMRFGSYCNFTTEAPMRMPYSTVFFANYLALPPLTHSIRRYANIGAPETLPGNIHLRRHPRLRGEVDTSACQHSFLCLKAVDCLRTRHCSASSYHRVRELRQGDLVVDRGEAFWTGRGFYRVQ
jgi:hypothetical protein